MYCAIIIVTIAHTAATFAVVRTSQIMIMINSDRFPRFYMTLFRHRTCTYFHGRADRFLVSVSNGQVAALSDRAYYQKALVLCLLKLTLSPRLTFDLAEVEPHFRDREVDLERSDLLAHNQQVLDEKQLAVQSALRPTHHRRALQ